VCKYELKKRIRGGKDKSLNIATRIRFGGSVTAESKKLYTSVAARSLGQHPHPQKITTKGITRK
jgi:hypothetical protein